MTHRTTLLDVVPLTRDTRHYVITKPSGYTFTPGQATEVAIDRDGLRDETRPFTFTSDPDADVLSFTIKSYFDHDGVTKELHSLKAGDSLLIGDPWGAIADNGPGVFLAGGAGITPFIGILSARARSGTLSGSTLVFANATERDIILRPLWEGMDGLVTVFVVEEESSGLRTGRIDEALLDSVIDDWGQRFYLCGPPKMEEHVAEILEKRGVPSDRITREE
ncbi:flavodoxin reductase [Tropicimonas sp. IMCC6043]|uniref:flavodoxin reductase n=1 Tax=Tropicimonas sp. IMCC6043 TaxID=2510645 RepID=UPI00101DD75C|nr:flavodoxin reductase [Tropicimonas sp. IMCC6043]RYH11325.1 flavodoxin reductase [Tropicimonas sp. IMCC6043]